MLPLNFGAPAPEELAALDVLSTWHVCYFCHWCSCMGWEEITVVDPCRHAVFCRHILTSFQVCCKRLVSALCHEIFIVLLSFYYFLLYFISYSYLDSIPSPTFCIVLWLIIMAENIVFKELLNNPFSVCLLNDKLGIVNHSQPTAPLPNLITHHKTKTENMEDIFVSHSTKRLTG